MTIPKPLYSAYHAMRRRCTNPKDKYYHRYGGRGVEVDSRWDSPRAFADWALENGWKQGLILDREDNEGNYSPENCRWVTPKVSSRNRVTSRPVTYKGETKLLVEWCEELDLNYITVLMRFRNKWTPEQALGNPTRKPFLGTN